MYINTYIFVDYCLYCMERGREVAAGYLGHHRIVSAVRPFRKILYHQRVGSPAATYL